MHLKTFLPVVLIALPLSAFAQLGFNLSGFSTQYSNGNVGGYETYVVLPAGSLPQNYNSPWIDVAPTLGGVKVPYMLVNGGTSTAILWSEILNVTGPNETFSYSGTSIYSGDTGSTAATIKLYVDGSAVGGVATLVYNAPDPGELTPYSVQLGNLSVGQHIITLVDTNGAAGGNDFALAPAAVPEPPAFAVLGIGALALFKRRKRS